MAIWAMDSSGLRHAHDQGVLATLTLPQMLTLSPLTWLPAGSPFVSAMKPEIRYPDSGAEPPATPTPFTITPRAVGLCDRIQDLYAAGTVVVADPQECAIEMTVAIEQCWSDAGGLAPLLHESVAVLLIAELNHLPLVTADPSVSRVARYRGLKTVSVKQFAAQIAA